jgi:hypothetical protein
MVERYLPGVTARDVEQAVRRTESAIVASGDDVTYLRSTFVPSEQSVFCLFEAPSADAIREINLRAGFRVDRIVEVRSVR